MQEILEPISQKLKAMEDYMESNINEDLPFISQVGSHIIQTGGKRIRPAILLLTTLCLDNYDKSINRIAGIIEYIHLATLLHDDVVDLGEIRRNQKTARMIWGNKGSVLVGDYLFTLSFKLMSKFENIELIKLISNVTNMIARGEILQLLRKNYSASTEEYLEIILNKTACLMAATMQIPAIMAEKEESVQKKLYQCGEHLGMAFQIIDDVLDYEGKQSGKTIGKDIQEKKITLPLSHLMEVATTEEKEQLKKILQQESIQEADVAEVIVLMKHYGILEYCRDYARKYTKKAEEILSILPENLYRSQLFKLANFICKREY